jgi:hypothetical protein
MLGTRHRPALALTLAIWLSVLRPGPRRRRWRGRARDAALLLCSSLVLCAALTIMGCGDTVQLPLTPLHVDDLEAYADTACPAQCARLSKLGCPEARPTAGGIPCEESCSLLLVRGIWTPDDVACVSSAGTVERVRLCRVRCRP